MLYMLTSGQYALFALMLFSIIFSLTFHEFGHAAAAKMLGDDTAEKMGRLNLNPISHIDPLGLLLVATVGFGYAKPVPFNPRNIEHPWGSAIVAFAGPFMNLLIAIVAANLYAYGALNPDSVLAQSGPGAMLLLLAVINLLLMLFNLIPLGPLDGHYILPRFLPERLRYPYHELNARYGHFLFLGLIILSIAGVPIFDHLVSLASFLLPLITIV